MNVGKLNFERKNPRDAVCGEDFCEKCGDCLCCYNCECIDGNGCSPYQLFYNRDKDGELIDEHYTGDEKITQSYIDNLSEREKNDERN